MGVESYTWNLNFMGVRHPAPAPGLFKGQLHWFVWLVIHGHTVT